MVTVRLLPSPPARDIDLGLKHCVLNYENFKHLVLEHFDRPQELFVTMLWML